MKLHFNNAKENPLAFQFFLLPRAFKFIGLFILATCLIIGIVAKFGHIAYLERHLSIIQFHLKNSAILGLLFMVFAKAKMEDGMVGERRAMAFSIFILYAVFKVGIEPEISVFMYDTPEVTDAQSMVVACLGLVLLGFPVIKKFI